MLDSSLLRHATPDVVDALLAVALDRLREARQRLAVAPDDPESVHAVRVAITRLREGLAPWGGLRACGLGPDSATALRRVHQALGRVRSDDVRRAHLTSHATARDGSVATSPDGDRVDVGASANIAAAAIVARLERRRPRRLARALRRVNDTLDPLLERAAAARHGEPATERAADTSVPAHAVAVDHAPFHRALERALQAAGQRVLDATDHGVSMASRHRARLALKRVRALLQPWIDAVPVLAPLWRVATAGQDLFGEERDLLQLQHFVARAVPRAVRRVSHRRRSRRKAARRQLALEGRALVVALHDDSARAADRVAREWLTAHGPSRVALHLALASACAALRALRPAEADADAAAMHAAPIDAAAASASTARSAASEPVTAESATSALAPDASEAVTAESVASAPASTTPEPPAPVAPDAPPLEIERKYLLRDLPERVREVPGVRIAQGWLPGERLRERLRRTVHPDGRVEWTRTVKLGTGIARIEIEEATDPILFESLWPFTSAARVEKIRHRVADGALTWEIDRFLDRALVLAEVELPSADACVSPPEWLAPYIVRDVTDEAEYVNANLARRRGHAPSA